MGRCERRKYSLRELTQDPSGPGHRCAGCGPPLEIQRWVGCLRAYRVTHLFVRRPNANKIERNPQSPTGTITGVDLIAGRCPPPRYRRTAERWMRSAAQGRPKAGKRLVLPDHGGPPIASPAQMPCPSARDRETDNRNRSRNEPGFPARFSMLEALPLLGGSRGGEGWLIELVLPPGVGCAGPLHESSRRVEHFASDPCDFSAFGVFNPLARPRGAG